MGHYRVLVTQGICEWDSAMGGTEGGGGELLIAVSIRHVSIERTIGFSLIAIGS